MDIDKSIDKSILKISISIYRQWCPCEQAGCPIKGLHGEEEGGMEIGVQYTSVQVIVSCTLLLKTVIVLNN